MTEIMWLACLTVQDVHGDAGRSRVGRCTRVVPGVVLLGTGDDQLTSGSFLGHDHAAFIIVVVDHPLVVVPEHVHRRLRASLQSANEPQLTAAAQMQVWGPCDVCHGLWNNVKFKIKYLFINSFTLYYVKPLAKIKLRSHTWKLNCSGTRKLWCLIDEPHFTS